ncbi:hypothetical protein JBL43_09070 [Aureibaculum sp. A20]|uniref:RraA family protein n=1 Tax=Aureibaculum flavum TaxID=2795986 RepID=A0ABS0WR02_9FLAO|nr:hypothetical protein [Aureibaculum flavum]MBJ2174386.1 hypothetical protein [Aureibaculum flavum]
MNFETAYSSENQVESIEATKVFNASNLENFLQELFKIPRKEDLKMKYSVDPLTISMAAKAGKFPLFPQEDGSLGIPVVPLSDMSDNTPKEFFQYMKYFFNSGIVKGGNGERSYEGYAHTHIAIAVDPDNPTSVAKIKKLNVVLTAKIKGDPANGISGWAEKYGQRIDAIVPIYIDNKKSVAHTDPFYGYDDITLKDGDIIGIIGDHVALLDDNNQGLQKIENLILLMEAVIKEEIYFLTREDYRKKYVDNKD